MLPNIVESVYTVATFYHLHRVLRRIKFSYIESGIINTLNIGIYETDL